MLYIQPDYILFEGFLNLTYQPLLLIEHLSPSYRSELVDRLLIIIH
jgi:hypothetical protein